MIQSLNTADLSKFTSRQISNMIPDREIHADSMETFVEKALKRAEYCFSKVKDKYFFDGQSVRFNHLNMDQYAMFLYFLSNTIWKEEKDEDLASRVFCLNKILHGLDAFYEVDLPEIFLLMHPMGTILGRGKYSDYFLAGQSVTIGANFDDEYPQIGRGVALYGGSSLVGKCSVGDNCLFAMGSNVMDQDIPSNHVVFGRHPNVSFKETSRNVIDKYFIA